MPKYVFTAKDVKGVRQKGAVEAADINQFYMTMKQRGLFAMTVSEEGAKRKGLDFSAKKLKTKQLAVFCRQLSTMLSAGLTIVKTLDILYQQTEDKHMKKIIMDLYEDVRCGDQLSVAFKKADGIFPDLMIYMFESGEYTGAIDVAAERLADNYEKETKIKSTVTNSIMYPAFLSGITVLVLIFLLSYVIPTFVTFFQQAGATLPAVTLFLLSVSHFLTTYWYLIVIVILALIFGLKTIFSTPSGKLYLDRTKLRLPVVGKLILKISTGRFARTLASLFGSGSSILVALEITDKVVGNAYLSVGLKNAREDVRRGIPLAEAIKRTGDFPVLLTSMIGIGEETGSLDSVLNTMAAIYEEEAENAIKKLVAFIEPIMIVMLALIVGFIVISIITPIFSLYSSIGNM